MGLSAPKSRTKLSQDPNNNAWSRSTSRFGHRVLISQGWTPGSNLGARDAPHSLHYTDASASHIRVFLKDDNLGLGAKRGKADGDQFGLEVLQGLLGRLNGKSEGMLKKEQDQRRDARLSRFQEQKWGRMGFVSGGFLVGDTIEDHVQEPMTGEEESKRRSKKRKISPLESSSELAMTGESQQEERSKKSKKRRSKRVLAEGGTCVDSPPEPPNSESETLKSEQEKSAKRRRKEEKAGRKKEKSARKEERRLKRQQKKLGRKNSEASDVDAAQNAHDRTGKVKTSETEASVSANDMISTRGRHVIRQRYIQQKRQACMDQKALNEIFMIKTNA